MKANKVLKSKMIKDLKLRKVKRISFRFIIFILILLFPIYASLGQTRKAIPQEIKNGVECYIYKVPNTKNIVTLKFLAKEKKLDLDILEAFNKELVNKNLRIGTKVYYPIKPQKPGSNQGTSIDSFSKFYKKSHTIKDENGTTISKNQKLKDFKLAERQDFVYVETNKTFIDTRSLSKNAKVIPRLYMTRPSKFPENKVFFQIVLLPTSLDYNTKSKEWKGKCTVICEEVSNAVKEISKPLKKTIQYQIRADDDELKNTELATIKINKVNHEESYDLVITNKNSKKKVQDNISINLREFGSSTIILETSVDVTPYIRASLTKKKIQGYGIETSKIVFSLYGSSNKNDIIIVDLQAAMGSLEYDTVQLSGLSIQTRKKIISIRSGGIKSDTINFSVSESFITPEKLDIEYIFPWTFIISALIGAILGTIPRLLRSKKKFSVRPLIVGIITGFFAAFLYWAIGLNVFNFELNIEIMNEVAVVAVSFLGGYIGNLSLPKKLSTNND